MDNVRQVVDALSELQEDTSLSKNVKERLLRTIQTLQESCEVSLKVDRALQELDEISDEPNLQTYTRTQIWGIVSMLEKRI